MKTRTNKKSMSFVFVALLAVATLLLAGCSSSNSSPSGSSSTTKTLNVYAAASLKGVFTKMQPIFEEQNPGTTLSFSFAGSSDLVTQITEGAPATVFASADTKNMDKLQDADRVQGDPSLFAKNTLQIVVPPNNPAHINSLSDLTKSGIKLVTCAVPVPCGNATATLQSNAGITLKPVSEEQSVTDVLNKVIQDEADAGIVYVTDAKGAGDKVKAINIASDVNVINEYPIALVQGSADQKLGQKFIDLVKGNQGQTILKDAGFLAP